MSYKILVPIASGTEEMEAVTLIDIMVRAGYDVTIASVDPEGALTMKASRGIVLTADCRLVEVADEERYRQIILWGKEAFRDSTLLCEMLKQHKYDARWMAAICASPALVLHAHNMYPKAIMTCHPSFEDKIPKEQWRVKRVVTDINHKLITSQGPGSALEFAMEIVIQLSGKPHAWSVAEPMVTLPNLHYHEMNK